VIIWKQLGADLHPIFGVYEIVPGFILCGLAAILVSLLGKEPDPEEMRRFEKAF
jgi:sodium/proline symporter